MTRGSTTRARAIATRCCSPPESWPGRWLGAVGEADLAEQLAGSDSEVLAAGAGGCQLRLDVLQGGERRDEVELLEDEPEGAQPQRRELAVGKRSEVAAVEDDRPPDGRSSAPSSWSSVVLPDPLGPSSATKSPASIEKLTPSTAYTGSEPRLKVFETLTVS